MDWLVSNTLDRSMLIDRFTNVIHDAAQRVMTHRDLDGGPSINDPPTANKTLPSMALVQTEFSPKWEATTIEVLNLKCENK